MFLVRALYVIWFIVALILVVTAVADLLFGTVPFERRVSNLLPRVAIALIWPLAILTPRGRYLLWARWKEPN